MYRSHFGLHESPFGITPNPAFFYAGNTRGEILQALLYVVSHGEGIIKVTGEVGSGKTMLCRMLESQLPPHIEVIYLVNPSLSPLEALFAIASELGLQPAGKRGDEVLRELHADLIAKHSAGKQVVLLVEEAQAMPLATLEEIRLLTNLETARNKLLQIVLFGQPELDEHLDLASMRQLKERITHSFEVPAMAPELVPEFLDFRLRAAGHTGPALFSQKAALRIARASGGIVRRINILADKALLAAYAADADLVEVGHVNNAIQDSPFKSKNSIISHATTAMSLIIVLLLAGIAWLLWRPPVPAPVRPAAASQAALAPAVSQAVPAPAGAPASGKYLPQ
ncbi:ExeA family protein [Rugamonas apoptosis]|uniref:AAA family ATPase n=1 Tax=Rugamonas apoptosis TaxID=2758570 RepID=A0A7W2F9G9_9BURK|nr:AAA family ATPase [Rugamonas apoptosis]MBA5687545.1 AAA family ATPase [Rugamonas apoptosis]